MLEILRLLMAGKALKEALVSLTIFGYGNQAYEGNEEAVRLLEGFKDVLRKVLPSSMKFRDFSIRHAEVVLETDTGDFPLEAVSGGTTAIIDTAWQIFLLTRLPNNDGLVITIDEPENHLHPKLQKTFIASLVETFPTCQFVVTTHSPFIVSCVKDSNVYVLDFNSENRVESYKLELDNKAATANDILRDVLGLDYTLPIWAGEKLKQIYSEASKVNEDEISRFLDTKLSEEELSEFYPEAMSKWLEKK